MGEFGTILENHIIFEENLINPEAVRKDAFELARANRASLNERYRKACERLDDAGMSAALKEFSNKIKAWTVSMNMRDDDLEFFLDLGYHRNIYHKSVDDLETFQAIGGNMSEIPNLQESMRYNDPSWFPKRNAYRQMILNEENFKYGALFLEGEALSKYGPYQVVLDPKEISGYRNLFVVKEDSLGYVNEALEFDLDRFSTELACYENAAELAVLKHEAHLMNSCEEAIAQLCFAQDDLNRSYLEVQIEDEVEVSHIKEIKIGPKYQTLLQEIAKKKIKGLFNLGNAADRDEFAPWTKFQHVQGKMRKLGMEIKKVE